MKKKKLALMSDRKYQMVPLDSIVVLNSRNRNKDKFAENVRSIDEVGLRKPIVVNGRSFKRTGKYELVCGEGRYLAHIKLEKTEIPAEVIDCDRKTALLYSLVENIARVPPGTMWFAREMERMHQAGLNYSEIARYVGKSSSYVGDYIRLVVQGENRLIEGVEQGLFPISFAVQVAQSDDATIQGVLMDAFDEGVVNSTSVARVRRLLQLRMQRGKGIRDRGERSEKSKGYTLKDLTREINQSTKEKEDYVRQARHTQNRLLQLLFGMSAVLGDPEALRLLDAHGLAAPPSLQGEYGVDLPPVPVTEPTP
ncbi:Chromosome-partitioning protein Spo0J [Pontiella desulfatans]|uniref:Chromosome-partitioning protein Spo0J n=1 Tax=Pontiella desulfatans TaxID=2750659 RepID=A0A6C2U9R7_PONDE|nr:ParB/RepB/Spo0J family partition protein [Pontiella desulfatans]VGO16629.1 Chromosome-partitioning protein Spo0J [Pontiella desulfatans]